MAGAVAVYAPMKPPDSDRPSGDRRMGRLLLQALARAGYAPEIASRTVTREAAGDAGRQRAIRDAARDEAGRLAARWAPDPPRLWLSYHNYYKAPDWLGPQVSRALGIPYALVEASHTPSRRDGPWALAAAGAAEAIAAADLVLQPNPADREAVAALLKPGARQRHFPPFLDPAPYAEARAGRAAARARLAAAHGLDPARPWLVTAAMMRADQKADSYALLADALRRVEGDAPLLIAGDGPGRPAVAAAFGDDPRVRFLGALAADDLAALYAASDLYVWPAVKEAYGFALLEAQAAGLAVVAGDRPGIAAMLRAGETARLVPEGDAAAFAAAVAELLSAPDALAAMGRAAALHVRERHGLDAAARRLGAELEALA